MVPVATLGNRQTVHESFVYVTDCVGLDYWHRFYYLMYSLSLYLLDATLNDVIQELNLCPPYAKCPNY